MKRYILSVILLISFALQTFSQQGDIVNNQGITSPLHRANTGRIVFTSGEINLNILRENDFLTNYELTNKSNLYITFFMKNSGTNYMHRLAPDLNHETLLKHGNFQYTFYIDGQKIYQDNLLPGAPYSIIMDSATVLSIPLINNKNPGYFLWSQYLWIRFMNNGGDKALSEGKHVLKMEIRTYVKNPDIKSGELIASGEITLLVNRKPRIDISRIQLNRIKAYDGIPVSSEKFDKDKIKELKGNIEEEVFKSITSFVVLKNGKLLIEEYFNGSSRDSLHNPRSVGKSFASTMMGIAIEDGYLKNENQSLHEFYNLKSFDNYSALKEKITIKDLITMSSVFDGNDDDGNSPGNEENMYPTADWVKFALDLPADTIKPKGEWQYFTAGAILTGDIINKSVPGGLEKYADAKLFKPLNIRSYKWPHTPQNVANTAGGIEMNSLDFAKYGQLYKNGGTWNGQQILSREWVNKTFTKQKPVTGRKNEYYGYFFWNKIYRIADNEYETYYCAGNGGNKIYVFKNIPYVIVVTATAYGAPYAHPQVDKMMQDFILPAVLNIKHH